MRSSNQPEAFLIAPATTATPISPKGRYWKCTFPGKYGFSTPSKVMAILQVMPRQVVIMRFIAFGKKINRWHLLHLLFNTAVVHMIVLPTNVIELKLTHCGIKLYGHSWRTSFSEAMDSVKTCFNQIPLHIIPSAPLLVSMMVVKLLMTNTV